MNGTWASPSLLHLDLNNLILSWPTYYSLFNDQFFLIMNFAFLSKFMLFWCFLTIFVKLATNAIFNIFNILIVRI
jgi:hypothetical protein